MTHEEKLNKKHFDVVADMIISKTKIHKRRKKFAAICCTIYYYTFVYIE